MNKTYDCLLTNNSKILRRRGGGSELWTVPASGGGKWYSFFGAATFNSLPPIYSATVFQKCSGTCATPMLLNTDQWNRGGSYERGLWDSGVGEAVNCGAMRQWGNGKVRQCKSEAAWQWSSGTVKQPMLTCFLKQKKLLLKETPEAMPVPQRSVPYPPPPTVLVYCCWQQSTPPARYRGQTTGQRCLSGGGVIIWL
jgi:hypothetical protein